MDSKKPFSVRHGIQPEPGPIVEDAPEGLRYFLLNYLQESSGVNPSNAALLMERFLRRPHLRDLVYRASAWKDLYGYIQAFTWWKVYDFIEYIYADIVAGADYRERDSFRRAVNKVFDEENIRYELTFNGNIVYRGSEAFEATVNVARSALAAANKQTAQNEMQEGLRDLSRRPKPDLTGAVHHAMNALESVAKDIWQEKGTLGDFIKRHPDQFPEPLATAVSKLYGFSSDKGRHIKEGGEPDLKEVELVVGIAATVTTYLIRTHVTGPE